MAAHFKSHLLIQWPQFLWPCIYFAFCEMSEVFISENNAWGFLENDISILNVISTFSCILNLMQQKSTFFTFVLQYIRLHSSGLLKLHFFLVLVMCE